MDTKFKKLVLAIVSDIKPGKVMTYGQIAAMAGNARASRIVGGIAHYGDSNLPWHRVVNKNGGLASGYPGGRIAQQKLLEAEGCKLNFRDGLYFVDLTKHLQRYINE